MPNGPIAAAAAVALLLPWAGPAHADAAALFDALGMPEIIEVMRDEGIDYGETIRADLLGGQGGNGWTRTVAGIYDTDAMRREMLEGFESRLDGVALDSLMEFFGSERGQRIVALEVEARRSLLSEEVEEAAKAAAADLAAQEPDRFALLTEFVEANDLVESNVIGALNSNYAFYMGLAAGDAFQEDLSEADILADVWSQEDAIRDDTEEWVYSYLNLAYDPLSDEDIAAYTALSRTPEGKALNRALFGAFDDLFVGISRRLGEGAAGILAGQDI
ncbi:MAG: DUF2059 domain-containing protein [Rhodobacteraceae bacterium]|jgi:hypothetical protein|nr:DUF2059 domain-containing protein [Paracoccaceae bacterium]